MPAFQPRSLRRSTADECWFSPVIKYAVPTSRESDASDNDISNTGNDGDDHDTASMVMVAMPPAHDQLLSGDHPSSEALKGHDHAQVDLVDNLDCYIGDGCRQKLSVVKQLGGGSWLLGSVAHLSLSAQKRQPCKIEIGGGRRTERRLPASFAFPATTTPALGLLSPTKTRGGCPSPPRSRSNRSRTPSRLARPNGAGCLRRRSRSIRTGPATRRSSTATVATGGRPRRSGTCTLTWSQGRWSILCTTRYEGKMPFSCGNRQSKRLRFSMY